MVKKIIVRNVKSKAEHITVSFSVNKKLAQVINGITVSDNKSRSRVITDLLEAGLEANGKKINYREDKTL
jgi:metal-responsive CopG/Arc/MetJ family transcriptional regulator